LWIVARFMIGLVAVFFVLQLMRFNVKVSIRDYTKGGRVITWTTAAREYTESKTNTPKLQFFGYMGFFGKTVNQPPSECIIPFRSISPFGAKKMYDFVRKDGIFYPIQNVVLGQLRDVEENGEIKQIYTLEGSGLEVSRDYDAEQSIQNTLIMKAQAYRNEKPSILYAMYGLAIILAIGSFITLIYSWNQFGNVGQAIASLREPLKEGIASAVSQKLGP